MKVAALGAATASTISSQSTSSQAWEGEARRCQEIILSCQKGHCGSPWPHHCLDPAHFIVVWNQAVPLGARQVTNPLLPKLQCFQLAQGHAGAKKQIDFLHLSTPDSAFLQSTLYSRCEITGKCNAERRTHCPGQVPPHQVQPQRCWQCTLSMRGPDVALAKGFVGHGSVLMVCPHPLPAISLARLKGVSTLEGAGFGMLLKKIKALCQEASGPCVLSSISSSQKNLCDSVFFT